MFKYSNDRNISLTVDKELNILVHRTPSYFIIYTGVINFKKIVHSFGPRRAWVLFSKRQGEFERTVASFRGLRPSAMKMVNDDRVSQKS